jgi:hypothetical protein
MTLSGMIKTSKLCVSDDTTFIIKPFDGKRALPTAPDLTVKG